MSRARRLEVREWEMSTHDIGYMDRPRSCVLYRVYREWEMLTHDIGYMDRPRSCVLYRVYREWEMSTHDIGYMDRPLCSEAEALCCTNNIIIESGSGHYRDCCILREY